MGGFSHEWEVTYQSGAQNSIWPWSDVVSKANRYFKGKKNLKVMELGCGVGANIPFFVSFGASYYGIDGSITAINRLQKRFPKENVIVKHGDFTKEIPFDEDFDLIVDRASVIHNTMADIQNTIRLAFEHLKYGGYYFGIDWFSVNDDRLVGKHGQYKEIDKHTYVFQKGYFEGLGNVHFSDEDSIRKLFTGYEIVELYEKIEQYSLPEKKMTAVWNFVVKK